VISLGVKVDGNGIAAKRGKPSVLSAVLHRISRSLRSRDSACAERTEECLALPSARYRTALWKADSWCLRERSERRLGRRAMRVFRRIREWNERMLGRACSPGGWKGEGRVPVKPAACKLASSRRQPGPGFCGTTIWANMLSKDICHSPGAGRGLPLLGSVKTAVAKSSQIGQSVLFIQNSVMRRTERISSVRQASTASPAARRAASGVWPSWTTLETAAVIASGSSC